MKREEVFAYLSGCYNGEPASCTFACPFRLDLRSFLKKASRQRWDAAAKELHASLPFPAVVSELCPRPCEKACQRSTVLGEGTISIGLIEKACLQYGSRKGRAYYVLPPLPVRVAVVGAGPAGLACAMYLDQKRYRVDVFEQNSGWGGSLRAHPLFPSFEQDFARRLTSENISFRYDTRLETLDGLGDYDAILVATGASGPDFGLADGWDRALGSTRNPRVFLCGEVTGLSVIDGMAHAAAVVKAMEAFLQSGSCAYAADSWDKTKCTRYVRHPDAAPSVPVIPAGDAYTREEAQSEAARCMQCDCSLCMSACELLKKYNKAPPRIAIDVAQDGQTRNSVSSACITRQTWSCNQCGRCASLCSEGADVCGMFSLSRADRVDSNAYPPAYHGYRLQEMEYASHEAKLVKAAPGETACRYLFFPGCRLGGVNPDYVERSYAFLLHRYGSVGVLLNCCGIPALWAGDRKRFNDHVETFRADWEGLGKPTVVYACASCQRVLSRFLPDIPLVSLYELLDGAQAQIPAIPSAAVFDPCAASGLPQVKTAVRRLAGAAGISVSAYDSQGKCCGFGGHMQLADPALYDEIAHNRCGETDAPFLVYCVNCAETFQACGKECIHILDAVFGLERRKSGTLDEKKRNNLRVKQALLQQYWGERFAPAGEEYDAMEVKISPDTLRKMERNLIPVSDVKKTILACEQSGKGFVNESNEIICRMVCGFVTDWVRYRKEGDVYVVSDVYSHRMRIREEGT